jgi:hypothetical protein
MLSKLLEQLNSSRLFLEKSLSAFLQRSLVPLYHRAEGRTFLVLLAIESLQIGLKMWFRDTAPA